MKTAKRAVLLVLCAILLVIASVLGTMAYLTDTAEVKNTFTVGNVEIKLDEAQVDEYGEPVVGADRIPNTSFTENAYKLIPNHTYVKDPTVTVLEGSEESFVRMLVTIDKADALDQILPNADLTALFKEFDADWVYKTTTTDEGAKTRTYEFRYNSIVDARDGEEKLDPLFKALYVPATVTDEQLQILQTMNITIVAQAIQADGFNGDADAAWAAFATQG